MQLADRDADHATFRVHNRTAGIPGLRPPSSWISIGTPFSFRKLVIVDFVTVTLFPRGGRADSEDEDLLRLERVGGQFHCQRLRQVVPSTL